MFRFAREVIMLVCTLAPAGLACAQADKPAKPAKPAGPAKPPLIRSVVVRGPLGLSSDLVSSISMLTPGLRATPNALEAGRLLVVESISGTPEQDEWLRKNLAVRSESVPEDPGRVDVVFEVPYSGPGRRFGFGGRGFRGQRVVLPVITGVNITGAGPIPPREVMAQLRTKPGHTADFDTILADMRAVEKYYDRQGYVASVVGQGFTVRNGVLDVPVLVSKISRMRFEGLQSVSDATVRKCLTEKPGDYYNANTFKKDYAALFKTGLFEDIRPVILALGPGDLELVLRFVEKSSQRPGAGGVRLSARLPTVIAAARKVKTVEPPRIVGIEVRGNRTLNQESVIAASGLKVGDVATPAVLEAAQRSLLATGNFGMRRIDNPAEAVKVSVTDVNPATNEGKLLIQVEENDVVQGFNITGNGPISPKEVQAQIQTKAGFVLNINTLRADIDRIQKYYDSKGYIASVDENGFGLTNGILDIPIVVGRIGRMRFEGLQKVSDEAVRKRLALKPGDFYNVNAFKDDYTALFNTGLFENIVPSTKLPRSGEVELVLRFVEKK